MVAHLVHLQVGAVIQALGGDHHADAVLHRPADAPQPLMQYVDAAQAEGFNYDALIPHGIQHLKDGGLETGGELQQKHIPADLGAQPWLSPAGGQGGCVHNQAMVGDLGAVAGIDTLKCGEAGSTHLHGAAAQHHLSVKGHEYAGTAGGGHGKGGAQIAGTVGQHICQRQLGAGEHHGEVDVRQHKGDGGSGIGHGVGAVGHHNAVHSFSAFKNSGGNLLPLFRGDVGGIQAHDVLHVYFIVAAQLLQRQLHHVTAVGLQSLPAGHGRDGSAGSKKPNFLFIHRALLLAIIMLL